MAQILQLKVDESQVDEMFREEIQKRLNNVQHRHTFWDMKELERQTCMSRPFIMDHFFHDERFKKIAFRVGVKWLFPARETEEFLLLWLREQRNR